MKIWIDAQLSPAIAAWINRTCQEIEAMKKLFTTSIIILFFLKICDVLFNHLTPALFSSESLAYKLGFMCGVGLIFIFAFKAYQLLNSISLSQSAIKKYGSPT